MAITQTGAIYKSLSFDNTSSRNYGVYITGEAVYNAPERAVEMISIPGRNGAFALDQGRFENIEVSYPAGIFADNEADFAQAVSDFRNFVCSRKGYCRLTDEYSPNEYRMAVYKSGLEVDPAQLRAGEFTITFDCKPQRWLTDGETPVDIGAWGDTDTETGSIVGIDNPDGILAIKDLQADIVALQSGSGTPSPNNVRPISGFTEVKVSRTGVNVWDEEWEVGNINSSTGAKTTANNRIRSKNKIAVIPNCQYFFSNPNGTGNPVGGVFFYDANDNYIGVYYTSPQYVNGIFTTPNNATYIYFTLPTGYGTTYNHDISINYPSTDTSYHAYQGDTYTIDLDGTRYGGTLDVTTGTLTVTHTRMDLGSPVSGSWNYATDNTYNVFYLNKEQLPALPRYTGGVITSLSDSFNAIANTTFPIFANGANNNNCLTITSEGTVQRILIRCDLYTSAASFQTAMSGHYVVYELATPLTVNLTAQEIELLQGTNNVWSSTGDVTVEYGQDPNRLLNPTMFDASPLLEVEGYGDINIGSQTVTVNNSYLGMIPVAEAYDSGSFYINGYVTPHAYKTITLDVSDLVSGDSIYVNNFSLSVIHTDTSYTITNISNATSTNTKSFGVSIVSSNQSRVVTVAEDTELVYGTASNSLTWSYQYTSNHVGGTSMIHRMSLYFSYDGNDTITFYSSNGGGTSQITLPAVMANSTKSILGSQMFIDLDIGEAYKVENGVAVSINNIVEIPPELPVLPSGATAITYDNTYTKLEITPRWWKI